MKAERRTLDYSMHPAPAVGRWEIRFAFLGGGVAWTLHLLGVYVVAEFGCIAGLGTRLVGGLSIVAWLLIGVTLLTGLLAAAASWTAWRAEAILRGATATNAPVEPETKAFVASVSRTLNAIFAFIIAAQGVPIFFYLRDCS